VLPLVGGVDALNTAGATTAITDADCTACGNTWCRAEDFRDSAYLWLPSVASGAPALYTGSGWQTQAVVSGGDSWDAGVIVRDFDAPGDFTSIAVTFNNALGDITGACPMAIQLFLAGTLVENYVIDPAVAGVNSILWEGVETADRVQVVLYVSNSAGTGEGLIIQMTARGTGANPFGENNC